MKTTFSILLLSLLGSAAVFADSFRVLGPAEAIENGDVISLVSLAPATNGHMLEGRKVDDDWGLAALNVADRGENSTTRWRVSETVPGVYALQCLGLPDGAMWLNGITMNGRVALSLSPQGVSGAGWGLYREGQGVNLKCLGKTPGLRWLVAGGGTAVALAENAENSSSLWQVYVWKKARKTEKPIAPVVAR